MNLTEALPLGYDQKPRRARILVVDDQPDSIRILHQMLATDYDVFMTTSGEQALPFCQKTPPDLVLLDVSMPDIDGLQVCALLKQDADTREIPVIFVTAGISDEIEADCWGVGGVDFVTKPVNALTLRHRIRAQLSLKFQADQLRKMAYIDGLTGISNRRNLEDRLALEWRRSQRNGRELAAIMVDVDHFKAYNDHYGHAQGDECLIKVARALSEACSRPHDIVARYGGEEFCCLLPETNLAGAMKIAMAIEKILGFMHIEHAGSAVAPIVTVSMGVAAMVPDEQSPSVLLNMADGQLYAAKQAGRNRIHAAS